MSEARPVSDRRDHYSYTHYADRAVAEGFDALRFSGPIGEWLARTQERGAHNLPRRQGRECRFWTSAPGPAAPRSGWRAMGRARDRGGCVERNARGRARRRAAEAGVSVTFDCGDAHALGISRSQLRRGGVACACSCTRPGGEDCLRELCRVSRARVVVDYPSARSAAAIQVGRPAPGSAPRASGGVRTGSFLHRAIEATLAREGFVVTAVHRQFVLPIALHKAMGSLRFTQSVETTHGTDRIESAVGIAGHHRGRAVRVLVTGATGYTGSRLACHLAARGHQVRATGPRSRPRDGDTRQRRNRARRRRICAIPSRSRAAAEGIDVIYNIAALVPRRPGFRHRNTGRSTPRR